MNKSLYFFILLFMFLITSCGVFQKEEEKKIETHSTDFNFVQIILDWFPNANHAGLYSAIKYDHFIENRINISIEAPSDPATILSLVSTDNIDFGIFYQPDLLLAQNEGIPVVAVASIVNKPLNAIMSLKDSKINSPFDLAGKKIGYPGIDWNRSMLATMLESEGLTIYDVELIDVGWSLAPALMSGEVDAIIGAYWTHESIVMENEGFEVSIIMPDQWGVPPYYELVLVTSEDTLNQNPNLVKRMVKAVSSGYTTALNDGSDALTTLISMTPPSVDIEVERAGIELLVPIWSNNQNPEFGYIDSDRWNEFVDWMKLRDQLPKDFDGDASFSNEFFD